MALTAQNIKGFTCPSDKTQVKKADGDGLFLLVKKNHSKLWRLRYKFAGKHQEMALGKYPSVPLSEARKLAEEARILLRVSIQWKAGRIAKKPAILKTGLSVLLR